jgi:poly(A) polymerase
VASVASLVEQPRYRAGYDFLRLRADVEEVPADLADWWEDYALGSTEEREALLQELKTAQSRRAPSAAKPSGRGPARVAAAGRSADAQVDEADDASGATDEADGEPAVPGPDEQAVVRKRRRRRRRPGPPPENTMPAPDA